MDEDEVVIVVRFATAKSPLYMERVGYHLGRVVKQNLDDHFAKQDPEVTVSARRSERRQYLDALR